MPLSLISNRFLLAFLLITLSTFANASVDEVGSVTEQTGNAAQIKRGDSEIIESRKGVGISMNDEISTAKTKMGLTFDDDTKVSISEQSTLVIDDFIYDPNAGTGKLAMNVALGTVRYSSGAIAANSRENVKLKTPTATISVRGTDFTMTVDELGRSITRLLPNSSTVIVKSVPLTDIVAVGVFSFTFSLEFAAMAPEEYLTVPSATFIASLPVPTFGS